ncbi:hypothetical protein E1B28_006931 [Marasmius oreades]|uniref:Uncharacterized protein n=1 Tax=Marasmius oreades TaxID=181124 RepID=A0A9P7UTI3_9AGAR|nr:uncharacterized protein E1B28_006931 [Marasmius oreades]KAG7093245.1 hypothetical protein E1B28_006931 [Marasmius oreades]
MESGQSAFDADVSMCTLIGFAFSLSTNIIVTSLIAGRIWWNAHQLCKLLVGTQPSRLYRRAIAIIVESGAIFSASLLILLVLYSLKFNAVYVSDSIAQITGIAPTLIIVRVGMGYSVDSSDSRDDQWNDCQTQPRTELSTMQFAREGSTHIV